MSDKTRIERVSRPVLERRLLQTLESDNVCAALLTERDLRVILGALQHWPVDEERRLDLVESLSALLENAFPEKGD